MIRKYLKKHRTEYVLQRQPLKCYPLNVDLPIDNARRRKPLSRLFVN